LKFAWQNVIRSLGWAQYHHFAVIRRARQDAPIPAVRDRRIVRMQRHLHAKLIGTGMTAFWKYTRLSQIFSSLTFP